MNAAPSRRLRILLVGEQAAGVRVLRLLNDTPHCVVGVATTLDPEGAGGTTVLQAARKLGLRVIAATAVRDAAFATWIRSQAVDLLLNVGSLHVAVAETVAAPRIGSFNLHPGSLPEYGGLNVPSWAIYFGETRHAVTLHRMTVRIDAGPIACRTSFPIEQSETGLSLTLKCVEHGLPLVSQLLRDATSGGASIPALEQDQARRRLFGADVPDQGLIRWSKPARQIHNFVRACDYLPFPSPWGHPRSPVERPGGGWVEIVKAALTRERSTEPPGTVQRLAGDGVLVAAGDECLVVEQVRVDGEYVAPCRVLRPGLRLEADPVAPSADRQNSLAPEGDAARARRGASRATRLTP